MCVDNMRVLVHTLYRDGFSTGCFQDSMGKIHLNVRFTNQVPKSYHSHNSTHRRNLQRAKIHAAPFTECDNAKCCRAVCWFTVLSYSMAGNSSVQSRLSLPYSLKYVFYTRKRDEKFRWAQEKKYNVQSCVAISIFYQNVKLLQSVWKGVITGIYIVLNVFNALKSLEAIFSEVSIYIYLHAHIFCKYNCDLSNIPLRLKLIWFKNDLQMNIIASTELSFSSYVETFRLCHLWNHFMEIQELTSMTSNYGGH